MDDPGGIGRQTLEPLETAAKRLGLWPGCYYVLSFGHNERDATCREPRSQPVPNASHADIHWQPGPSLEQDRRWPAPVLKERPSPK